MSYCIINKIPVFLTRNKWITLRNCALKDKDSEFRVKSFISGFPENKEAEELMFKYLKQEYKRDEKKFIENWVKFDLKDEEAKENIWDLLYDYSDYTGNSFLSDIRSPVEAIIQDYYGESYEYPMGKTFVLNFGIKHHTNIFRKFLTKSQHYIKILINTDKVLRIKGTLDDFYMVTHDFILHCTYTDIKLFPL